MIIAVTGGAGFLGSHMVKRLLKTGDEVRVIDDLSSGSMRNLLDLGVTQDCIKGDLRDLEFARSAVKNCEVVYHFAADIGNVEYLHGSASRELSALQSNMVIDANVFKACVEARVERIIYASSVSVYSIRRQLEPGAVFREEDAFRVVDPEGGYGWAKYIAEKQLEMMTNQVVGVARIFHAYGENIYLAPDRSQVLASLIRKAIRYPRERFVVWGDGAQKRCFVFVSDVIDALQRLEEHVKEKGSLTVNVGSQQEISVRELAHMIVGLSGKEIKVEFDASKPTGALNRMPDLSRIKSELGWEPRIGLQEGLRMTYDWAVERLAGI